MTNLSPVVLWQTPTFRQQVFLQCSLTQSQLFPETTRRTALILINMNINYRHLFDCSQEPSPEASQLWIPSTASGTFFPSSPLVHSTKAPCITKPNLSHPLLVYESFKSYKSLQSAWMEGVLFFQVLTMDAFSEGWKTLELHAHSSHWAAEVSSLYSTQTCWKEIITRPVFSIQSPLGTFCPYHQSIFPLNRVQMWFFHC